MRSLIALVMASAVAVAVTSTSVSAAGGRPIAGGMYPATFVDQSGMCASSTFGFLGGFAISISDYGYDISDIAVELHHDDMLPGPVVFPLGVSIPVAEDGTFYADFMFGLGIGIHVDGQFEGDSVSGLASATLDGELVCEGTFSGTGRPGEQQQSDFFTGRITDEGNCGGGQITIIRFDRESIRSVAVEGVKVDGQSVTASAHFDQSTVPISLDDGRFQTYFPSSRPGEQILVSGRMDPYGSSATGAVEVSPSDCKTLSYTVYAPRIASTGGGGVVPASGAAWWRPEAPL